MAIPEILAAAEYANGCSAVLERVGEELPHLPNNLVSQRRSDADPATPQPVLAEILRNAILVLCEILPVGDRIALPRHRFGTQRVGKAVLQQVDANAINHRAEQKSCCPSAMADYPRQTTEKHNGIGLKEPAAGKVETNLGAITRRVNLPPDFRHRNEIVVSVVQARDKDRQRRQSSPRKALASTDGT